MNHSISHDGPHNDSGPNDDDKDPKVKPSDCSMIIDINGAKLQFHSEGVLINYDGYEIMIDKCCKDPDINLPEKDSNLRFYKIEIIKNKEDNKSLGDLYINGKKIDYEYNYVTGEISQHSLFNIFYDIKDLARSYISANPTLADIGHHH